MPGRAFVLFSLLFLYTSAQNPALFNSIITLPPCTTNIYQWTVSTTLQEFDLSLALTPESNAAFTIVLFRNASGLTSDPRGLGCHALCVTTTSAPCSPQLGNLACEDKKGTWYYSVSHSSPTPQNFSVSNTISPLAVPSVLPLSSSDSDKGTTFAGGAFYGNSSDIEYYLVDLDPVEAVDGSRFVVRVKSDNPVTVRMSYGTSVASATCSNFVRVQTGTDVKLVLSPCEYEQGGKYLIAVNRLSNTITYNVLSYVDVPEIIPILVDGRHYGTINQNDKLIYYSFVPTQAMIDGTTHFVAVISDVTGGEVRMSIRPFGSPVGRCPNEGGKTSTCSTFTGCHVRVFGCDIQGKSGDLWYVSVHSNYLDDMRIPIQYTIDIFSEEHSNHAQLAIGGSYPDKVKHGKYRRFFVPAAEYGPTDWVRIYVYFDASDPVSYPLKQGTLYVSPSSNAGSFEHCQSYQLQCDATVTNRDYKACSVQLDPCNLAENYPDGIYFSIYGTETINYYFEQQDISFTLLLSKFTPDNQYIDENTIINGVVASKEYAIYRVAPFSSKSYEVLISAPTNVFNPVTNIGLPIQDFCDSYSHLNNEACVQTGICCVCDTKCVDNNFACPHSMLCSNPAKRALTQQNQNTVLEVKVFYGPELIGDYCKGGCRIPDRAPTVFINTGDNPASLGTFDSCDAEGNGFYVAIKGNDRNVIAGNNYRYTEIPFVLTVTTTSLESDIQIIVAEPGIEYSPRDFNKVYFELSFERSNALKKDIFFTTRGQPNPLSSQQLFAISDSVSTTCGVSNGAEIDINLSCNGNSDGYCYGFFRGCGAFTQSNINGKFLFYARTTGTFEADGAMSFRYDVVEQSSTELIDGLSIVDTLKWYVYNHYTFYVPPDAVNKKNLILEVYFENGPLRINNGALNPTLYVLHPNAGDSRAGDPNDCLCLDEIHQLQSNENGKLAFSIEACSIKEGTYHFSILSQQPIMAAAPIHYTITASLQNPVEGPYDLSATEIIETNLFGRLKKILVFNIQPFVPSSVDQVLRIDLTTAETLPNQAFRARLYYTPEGSPTTCACASDTSTLGQLQYNTNPHSKISGSIVVPSCFFSHTETAKLNLEIENVASSSVINSHIHAFSVHASIKNAHPVVTQLKVDTPCNTFPFPDNKKIVSVVKDRNYQFFYVDSNDAYAVVVDSAQDGVVTLFGGPGQVAVSSCASQFSGQNLPIVRPVNCPSGRGNFSVYGNANSEKPVTFTIYACSATSTPIQENSLTIGVAKQESLTRFTTISYKIDVSTLKNADALQLQISNSIDLDISPVSIQLRRVYASSGGCNAVTCPSSNPIQFEPSDICAGNCYAVVLKCRFPQDFDQGTWYLDIQNQGGSDVSYSVVYNVISKTDLSLPAGNHINTNFTIPVGQLRHLTYSVTSNQILLWSTGQRVIQYDLTKYNAPSGQSNFLLYRSNTDGTCTTTNTVNFYQCCASSFTNVYGIFNADPVNAVVINWKADIDTVSLHKAKAAGETETLNVPAMFTSYPAMFNVYVDYTPVTWVDASAESALWITVERGSMIDGRLFITTNDNPAGVGVPCINNPGFNQNFQVGDAPADYSALTLHDDSCRNLYFANSGRFWIGVLNRDASAVTVPLNVHVEPASAITLGTTTSFDLRLNLYKLYYIILDDALANDPNVRLNVNLNQDNNTIPANLRVSLQINYPNCQGAPAPITPALVGASYVINTNISSCNWVGNSGKKLYFSIGSNTALPFGVQRRIAGSFTVTKVTSQVSNDHGTITVGTALSTSLASGEIKRFRFRSSASTSITSTTATYYRAQANNFDIANPSVTITFETDTKRMCVSSLEADNTFCNLKRDTCYGVLHPCRLFPNTDYVVVVSNSGSDASFSLLLNTFTKQITELSLSNPKTNDLLLPFGDIQFYHFSLKGVLSYYELFDLTLTDLSCGSLRYYVESDNVAGPDCYDTTGTTSGSIFSRDGCALTADLDTEYYVTVIGTDQYSVSPLTYKFALTVKNTATLVNLQPGEMDYLRYIPDSIVTPPVCPVPSSPFVPCCSSSFVPATTMRQENKLWVYTVEGYNYIEEHDVLIIEQLVGGIQSVSVTLEHRRIYTTGDCTPVNPSPNPNPIDCIGSPCEISLYDYDFIECHGKDVQVFIAVTVTFNGLQTGNIPLNVISLYHKRTPYALSDVIIPSSPTTKTELFYQFSLPFQYRQLFRFNHPSTYQNNNYKFKSSLDSHTPGSQLQLRNSLSRCPSINQFCNQNQPCRTTSYPPQCGTYQPDFCTCNADNYEELRVDTCTDPTSLGANNRTYLTLYANDNGPAPVQTTTLRLDYYINILPLVENTCIKLETDEVIYYSYTFANPKSTERFDFSFEVISGSGDFSVEDGCNVICSNGGSGNSWSCQNERGSSNSFVIKILAYEILYFKIVVSKQNNTFTNLQNGVEHSNPTTVFNPCENNYGNNLYSYTSSAAAPGSNKYLLFEFFYDNNGVDMEITPDHTYSYFTGEVGWRCTVNGGYCSVIIGCGYSATTYFIHLPVSSVATFRIKATEGTSRVVDGVFGRNLFTPGLASGILPGEIISFKFPLKSTVTPDDIISSSSPAFTGLTRWITRNYFGDQSCLIGTGIRPCAVSSSADEFFFVNFFYAGNQVIPCQLRPYAFTVTQYSRYLTNRITAQNAQANVNVTNSLVSLTDRQRFKLTFPALTNDDVLVISFTGQDKTILVDGEFGNYKNGATVGYNAPCACSRLTNEQFSFPVRNQIILDKCDHCGNSYYDSYFIDVRMQNALAYPFTPLSYSFQYTVKKYKPLTATFARHSLRSDTIDHEFFKVSVSDSQAQRLELEILGSRGVLVEVLIEDCQVIKSLNCLKGNLCQLPLPDHRNIGDLSSSSTLYFRVTGFDTQFQIRYLKGFESLVSLTATEAPFCTPFIASQVWGPAQALSRRDNHASKLYSELFSDFSCGGSACTCTALSEACLNSLKLFACSLSLRPGDGRVLFVQKADCLAVETNCGKTFVSTDNFKHFSCSSSAYQGYDLAVDPRINPDPPISLILNGAGAVVSNVLFMLLLIVLLLVN